MSDILCIYYSRTGNTKKAMEEIASALDAELAELRDGVDRSGWKGWLRCGLDAMREKHPPRGPGGDGPAPGGVPAGDPGDPGVGGAVPAPSCGPF